MPFLVFYGLYNPVPFSFLPHNWERKWRRGSPAAFSAANKVFQQTALQEMGQRAYYRGFQYRQLSFFLLILTAATAESAKQSEGSGDPTLDPTLPDILDIHRLRIFVHEGVKNFSQYQDPSSVTPRSACFWKSQKRFQDTFAISLIVAAAAVIFLVLMCHQVHQMRASSAAAARRLGDEGNRFPLNCPVSRLPGMSSSHTTGPFTCSKAGGDVSFTGCCRYHNCTISCSSSTISIIRSTSSNVLNRVLDLYLCLDNNFRFYVEQANCFLWSEVVYGYACRRACRRQGIQSRCPTMRGPFVDSWELKDVYGQQCLNNNAVYTMVVLACAHSVPV